MSSTLPVRILGIDPGFDRLGVAVLEKNGNREQLIFSTCIVTTRTQDFSERLHVLGNELQSIIETYTPGELAMENLFFAKNQTTAIKVAEVRGVVLFLCASHTMNVFEYSPPEIKVAVAGHGKASKTDVARMVSKFVRIPTAKTMLDDEIDAIAIALTHSAQRNVRLRLKGQ